MSPLQTKTFLLTVRTTEFNKHVKIVQQPEPKLQKSRLVKSKKTVM